MTYRIVSKLAETICPTKGKKKSTRVNFFEKEPKWFDSVTRRLKRLAQKRARSDDEEDDGDEGEDEVVDTDEPAPKKKRTDDADEQNGQVAVNSKETASKSPDDDTITIEGAEKTPVQTNDISGSHANGANQGTIQYKKQEETTDINENLTVQDRQLLAQMQSISRYA